MFLLSALSAESKKETNSLRSLRLCGDYKLSNYNTIPYLRIHVLMKISGEFNSKVHHIKYVCFGTVDRATNTHKEHTMSYLHLTLQERNVTYHLSVI